MIEWNPSCIGGVSVALIVFTLRPQMYKISTNVVAPPLRSNEVGTYIYTLIFSLLGWQDPSQNISPILLWPEGRSYNICGRGIKTTWATETPPIQLVFYSIIPFQRCIICPSKSPGGGVMSYSLIVPLVYEWPCVTCPRKVNKILTIMLRCEITRNCVNLTLYGKYSTENEEK